MIYDYDYYRSKGDIFHATFLQRSVNYFSKMKIKMKIEVLYLTQMILYQYVYRIWYTV